MCAATCRVTWNELGWRQSTGYHTKFSVKSGPSVSPINGLVASFAATEFMLAATGMREPRRLINYAGHLFRLTRARARDGDCPYCNGLRGQGAAAEVERYLKIPHLGSGRAQVTADSGHAGRAVSNR